MFNAGTVLLMLGICTAVQAASSLERIESGLLPPVTVAGQSDPRMTLDERMQRFQTPAVSIAVIEGGQIAWSRAYGNLTAGSPAATPQTLFQAASISKPIAAAVALTLVHEGRLSLDEPVNRSLTSWQLSDGEAGPAAQVTLRKLLSHAAGLSVSGFDGYSVEAPLPSLRQVLEGAAPANSERVRIVEAPGRYRYSGGGYTLVQQLIEDAAKEPFQAVASRLVLTPAGMRHSVFAQPLPTSRQSGAATAHAMNGEPVAGRWRVHPELAAAGLWSTPNDLAQFMLWVMEGLSGRPVPPAQKFVANHLVERQTVAGQGGATSGLGFSVVGEGRALQVRHNGQNEGYAAVAVMFPQTGQGAVIMTNGDGARPLIDEVLRAIAAEYRWPVAFHETVKATTLTSDQLREVAGSYTFGPGPNERMVFGTDATGLTIAFGPRRPAPLIAIDAQTFVDPQMGARFRFESDTVTLVSNNGAPLVATREPSRPN